MWELWGYKLISLVSGLRVSGGNIWTEFVHKDASDLQLPVTKDGSDF